MIRFVLDVEDLADTRFALSPLHETLCSLRVLQDPGLYALHLPWCRSVRRTLTTLGARGALDAELLRSLVARRRTLPDFLTPTPTSFAPTFEDELAVVRRTPAARVRHDLLLAHAPDRLPEPLRSALGDPSDVTAVRDALCALLRTYWEVALEPSWSRMRQVLEADMTYRARQLALGGPRLLFTDLHPNLRWQRGELSVDRMLSRHRVAASGRGLLLLPSVFAHKPAPPVSPDEPPTLVYPCRGVATLWETPPVPTGTALASLLGAPRARLLVLLTEPLATVDLARRVGVTPSAVSQHLRVLHETGLVTRARSGRQVLYRRSPLGDRLAEGSQPPAGTGAFSAMSGCDE